MGRLQDAKLGLTTLALALPLVLGACGDSSSPDAPFDPERTSADLAAVNSAFGSATYTSFTSLGSSFGPAISAAAGSAPLSVVSGSAAAVDLARGGAARTPAELHVAARRAAKALVAALPKSAGPRVGRATARARELPAAVLGKTYVYDLSQAGYVVSDRTGAPASGVRFILYAVNPVTGQVTDPLTEVGYADLIDRGTASAADLQVLVVSGGTTHLDYRVTASGTENNGVISITGFITDGTHRADFNLVTRATADADGTLILDYDLALDARDVTIDLTFVFSGLNTESSSADLELELRGPNGTVVLEGNFSETGGTIVVKVNGDTFATIQGDVDDTEPTIVGAEGRALTDAERQALKQIFEIAGRALVGFLVLLSPVDAFTG